jgi:HAD superfamily phosphoserine phosphatase-like hydrolase
MLSLFRVIPKQQHLTEVLQAARDNGMATAIVSASYQFLVDSLCADLGIPQGIANTLILQDNLATGELHIHNQNHDPFNGKVFSIHKGKVLENICNSHHLKPEEAIAIGDGPIDCSMLQCAGLGVAFNASEEVKAHSDLSITDFRELLPYITG